MLTVFKCLSGHQRFWQLNRIGRFIRNYLGLSNHSRIGIWIAPNFCCVAEFLFPGKGTPLTRWSETFSFAEYNELHTILIKLVNKHWLRGLPVTLSLATNEIFTTPAKVSENSDIEISDLLPSVISWDSVGYAIHEDQYSAFACMRHSDIDFWVNLCKNTGLIVGAVIPSGMWWSRLLDSKGDIPFSLPSGTFISRNEDGLWKGSLFIPDTIKKDIEDLDLGFNSPVQSQYSWCDPSVLPALEGILLTSHDPLFNLNMNTMAAEKMINAEKNLQKICQYSALIIAVITVAFFVTDIGLKCWYKSLPKRNGKNEIEKISELRKEEMDLQRRILSIQRFIESKNAMSKMLHDFGNLVRDSIWYSEMLIVTNNKVNTTIIGHSLSESAVNNLLNRADSVDGVKKVRLEYIEKIPAEQIKSNTGGLRSVPLFRYKLILN